MMSMPTVTVVKGLADICARCHVTRAILDKTNAAPTVSTTVASFISRCIHSVRKTIAMPVYLGFLIDSVGILSLDRIIVSQDIVATLVMDIDQGVRDASACLVDCGTAKVIPMLEPLLTVLLDKGAVGDPNIMHRNRELQARVGLSLLAVFSLDLTRGGAIKGSVFDFVSDGFSTLVVKSISHLLSAGAVATGLVQGVAMERWILPIIALFSSEKGLMSRVFGQWYPLSLPLTRLYRL